MSFQHGSFRKSTGEKGPSKSSSAEGSMDKTKELVHGKAQSPHGGGEAPEEHITKTHPGETEPHPVTGVHAFHAHHVGDGKFVSHTHHEGGEVERREHPHESDMHQAHQEAFPSQGEGEHNPDDGSMGDFGESLGGIGGNAMGGE